MIRVLAKYLISFFILLLCGYSNPAIPSHQSSAQYSSVNDYSTGEFVNLNETIHGATLSKKPYSPGNKRLHHDLIVPIFENEEEDKLTHAKKYLKSNNYFITLFSINTSPYHFNPTSQVLYPTNNTTISENAHRYIAFGVFRI